MLQPSGDVHSQPDGTLGCLSWRYIQPTEVFANKNNPEMPSYQWLSLLNEAHLSLIFKNSVNSSTDILDSDQNLQIPIISNVSDLGYSFKRYNLSRGLYQLHFDGNCLYELFNSVTTTIITVPLVVKSTVTFQRESRNQHIMTSNTTSNGLSFIIKEKSTSSDTTAARESAAAFQIDKVARGSLVDSHLLLSSDGNTTPSVIISDNSARQPARYNTTIANKDKSQVDKSNHKLSSKSEERFTNLTALPLTQTVERNISTPDKNVETNLSAIAEISRFEGVVNTTYDKITVQTSERSHQNNSVLINAIQQRTIESIHYPSISNKHQATILYTSTNSAPETSSVTPSAQPTDALRHDMTNTQPGDRRVTNPHSDEYAVLEIIEPVGGQAGREALHTDNHVIVNSQKQPGYEHRLDYDQYVDTGSDKSLMAIIISLCTALVAVVGIIVIFLLIEFFSRRRQIRKTRIRPYVSYY